MSVQGFWDKTIKAHCAIDDSKFFFGTVIAHLVIDMAILVLPIVQIKQLRLPTAQRLGVTAMFMFGVS